MACNYWVNGKKLSEIEFKQLLAEGLLDQLVLNLNFKIENFEASSEFLESELSEPLQNNLRLPVQKKINQPRLVNIRRKVEAPKEGQRLGQVEHTLAKDNPRIVLEQANKKIKSASRKNKFGNRKGEATDFMLATVVNGELKFGDKSSPLAKKAEAALRKNKDKKYQANLKEGGIYMLVPSADGLVPVWMRTSMIGETKDRAKIKDNLKKIFNPKSTKEEVDGAIDFIQNRLYRTVIEKTGDSIRIIKTDIDGTTAESFDNYEDAEVFLIGKFKNGEYVGEVNEQGKRTEQGQLARVDYRLLNSESGTFTNKYYADNGYITTDIFSDEAGNFFNSSSFVVSPTGNLNETIKKLEKDENIESIDAYAEEQQMGDITSLMPENQDTKIDESEDFQKEASEKNKEKDLQDAADKAAANIYMEQMGKNPLPKKKQTTEEEKNNAEDSLGGLFNINPDDMITGDERTKLVSQPVNGNTQSIEDVKKEIEYIKKVAYTKGMGIGTFKNLEQLKKYLPEDIFQRLVNARKNGKVVFGLYSKAATFLHENAMAGTGYHEAFHIVFNLSLTLEQRVGLIYDTVDKFKNDPEFKSKTSETPTFLEVEEFLADKFQEYVLSNEGTTPSLSKKIADFFRSLFREIKFFFNPNAKISAESLFKDIDLGIYKNKIINFKNTDLSKIDNDLVRFKIEESFEHPNLEYAAVGFLKNKTVSFLNKLEQTENFEKLSDAEKIQKFGIQKFYGELAENLITATYTAEQQLANTPKDSKIYNIVKNVYEARKKAFEVFTDTQWGNLVSIAKQEIESNVLQLTPKSDGSGFHIRFLRATKFLETFNRSLRDLGIKINLNTVNKQTIQDKEDTTFQIDLEEDTLERWQRANIEINPLESISQVLKRHFASIQKRVPNNSGEVVYLKNALGAPENYSGTDIFNFLSKNITDSYSVDEMMKKLDKVKNKQPFVKDVINLVESDSFLKTKLYTTLASKTFQEFSLVYEKDGEYRVINSNRMPFEEIIQSQVMGNFMVQGSKFFNKYPKDSSRKGETNFESINKQEIDKSLKSLETLRNKVRDARTKEQILPLIEEMSKLFTDINLPLSIDQLTKIWNPTFDRYSYQNIMDVIVGAEYIFEALSKGDNVFLSNIPKEFLSDKGKSYSSTPLREFAVSIKNGFEDTLVPAFRNAENKTVYAVQYSNYLNKHMAVLNNKEKFEEYHKKIKNDPLLSNLPIITDSLNEEGEFIGSNFTKASIFDALARKGKKQSVPYSKLSDQEIIATELALFSNNQNSTVARYTLPIPADSTVMPLITAKKYSNEEVVKKLVQTAQAEIARIKKLNNLPEDADIKRISNYVKKASEFTILSFLNDRIENPLIATDEVLTEIIKEYLENDFLNKQIDTYTKFGAISKVKDGKILFKPKIINNKVQNSTEFFKNFLYNQYFFNTQMTTLFAGDPAFYKNTEDYQKRYKQIVSPGSYTNTELIDSTYKGYIFQDELVPTVQESVDFIIQNIKNSDKLTKTKKKELIAFWEQKSPKGESKNHNNHTDAATFISVERMEDILRSEGRLTKEKEEALERVKKGEERAEDLGMFEVIKPFQFTKQIINGIEVPIQVKNSEILLTKSYANRSPKLQKVFEILNGEDSNVSFVAFDSAVKVGGITNPNGEFSKLTPNADGSFSLPEDSELITLNQEDWRRQQETPNHIVDDSSNFGSQLRVLAIADLDFEGTYDINGEKLTGAQVAEEYQNLIVENLKTSFEEVSDMFLDEEGDFDIETLVRFIKKEFNDRGLGEEYFEAIELVKDQYTGKLKTKLPLWHPLVSYKIESVLNSFFKNRVTKQKINGGQVVNATSYGVADSLKYIPETNTFQALLPAWTKKFFHQSKDGSINIEDIPEELKRAIAYRIPTEDKYSIFNIEVVGFADGVAGGHIILPVEATTLAGLDFDIDKMFIMLPSFRINREGNPVYIKNFNKDKKPTSEDIDDIAYFLMKSRKDLNLFLDTYVDNKDVFIEAINKSRENYMEALKEKKQYWKDANIQEAYDNIKNVQLELKHTTDNKKRKALEIQFENLKKSLGNYSEFKDNVAAEKEAYLDLEDMIADSLEQLIETDQFDFSLFENKQSRDNRILEILRGIMQDKKTALATIDPGNFEKLREIGNITRIYNSNPDNQNLKNIRNEGLNLIKKYRDNKIGLFAFRNQLKEIAQKLDSVDFNINLPSTQLELYKRNMTGAALIGPIANQNTHHAKAQYTNLRLSEPINIDGFDFFELNRQYSPFNGERISKSLAIKLAAVVDNTKDPISSYINLNMYTVDVVGLLSRLGVQEETIFAIINQPVILELTQKHFDEQGSISGEDQRVFEIINIWKNKMAKELGIPLSKVTEKMSIREEGITFEELEDSLINKENEKYYETQLKVLTLFQEYKSIAKELGENIAITRGDTQTRSVGPTSADNYSFINKQDKVLNKANPKILGTREFLFEEGELKINPGFHKYAWINPISVMNKAIPAIGSIDSEGNISYSLLGKIKNFFSELKDDSYSLNSAEARAVDTHFLSYIASALPAFKSIKDGTPQAVEIIGKLPTILQKFKNRNTESKYAPFLNQLVVKEPTKNVPFKTIQFFNSGRTSEDIKYFRNLWSQMINDSDESVKKLGIDLIRYTYFSNGYAFGPKSFFNITPVEFWTDDFANKPGNEKYGLKTSDGRTLNKLMEDALYTDEESYTDVWQNFLDQFIQNTATSNYIVPSIEIKDALTNTAPEAFPTSLGENEVIVVMSSNSGAHNGGLAKSSFTFDSNKDFIPIAETIGKKGKWLVYGETNKISKGKNGRGFAIPSYPDFFTENNIQLKNPLHEVNRISKNNPEEFNKLQTQQRNTIKKSLVELIKTANENEETTFNVRNLDTPLLPFSEIRKLLVEIHKEYVIPGNIALMKRYEVRNYGKAISKNNSIYLPIKTNQRLKRKDGYAKYIKAKVDNEVQIFKYQEMIESSKNISNTYIKYERIPILGFPQHFIEYNIYGNLNESSLDKIIDIQEFKEAKNKSVSFNDVDILNMQQELNEDTQLDALSAAAFENAMKSFPEENTSITNRKSDKSITKDPLGLAPEFDPSNEAFQGNVSNIGDKAPSITDTEGRKTQDYSYNNYTKLFNLALEKESVKQAEKLTNEQWAAIPIEVKQQIIKCL